MRQQFVYISITFLFITLWQSTAIGCPLVGGLVDFNCDGKHKIVVIGDSVVRGIKDIRNKNNGGYVKRLQKKFPTSTFANFGFAGYSTERIYSTIKEILGKSGDPTLQAALGNSDLIIIDEGRNDYFEGFTPGMSVRNMKRLVSLLNQRLSRDRKSSGPLIEIATLIPTNRGYQRTFIETINEMLIKLQSEAIPVGFYFNSLPNTILSSDGLHPDSTGYSVIARFAANVIATDIQTISLSKRPDDDGDGIYDKFENSRYKTDPLKIDTDQDELTDGEEIFTYFTDALTADTDGDGINDGAEVQAGTDPLVSGS